MTEELNHFYQNKNEPNRSCLLALRKLILQQHDALTETIKYGMPCFCYSKKPFCYLWIDKKSDHPYILMVQGINLHHPMLVQGDREKMKVLNVDPNVDLPIAVIIAILKSGLELYRI